MITSGTYFLRNQSYKSETNMFIVILYGKLGYILMRGVN
jgi:hypothetical protein